MKNKNNKKINCFRIVLFILLIISLLLYLKLYVLADDVKSISVDLPDMVTSHVWYEYGSLNKLEFTVGNFKYSDKDNEHSSCSKYYYNDVDKLISFNCKNYEMKLVSVSNYKLILVINNTDVMTYYSSLELVNYLMDNNITNIADTDIEKIMDDNDFIISKVEDSEVYKNIQVSKLSAMNELSIDEYISLKEKEERAIVLLINPNMSVDAYDLIPIFISWQEKYEEYNFYYVNGVNLKVNDSYILDKDKVLKDYLVGIYNSNILIFNDGNYRRISVDVIRNDEDDIFECKNYCDVVELKIYDNEYIYESLDEILEK